MSISETEKEYVLDLQESIFVSLTANVYLSITFIYNFFFVLEKFNSVVFCKFPIFNDFYDTRKSSSLAYYAFKTSRVMWPVQDEATAP